MSKDKNSKSSDSKTNKNDATEQQMVDTYNYDTNFAATYSAINGILKASWSDPSLVSDKAKSAKASQTLDGSDDPYAPPWAQKKITNTLDASFDPWQLLAGGGGRNVWIRIPFGENSTLIKIDSSDADHPIKTNLKGGWVNVEVHLQFLPDPKSPQTQKVLVTKKTEDVNTSDMDRDRKAACIISVQNVSNAIDPSASSTVGDLMDIWLNTHGAFDAWSTIFHVLDISSKLDTDPQWDFVRPKYQSYSVTSNNDENGNPSEDLSIFAIATMIVGTDGKDHKPPNTDCVVSPLAIPRDNGKSNSAFIISRYVFTYEMLMTGAAMQFQLPAEVTNAPAGDKQNQAFQEWTANTFMVKDNSITNKATVCFGNYVDDDGKSSVTRKIMIDKENYTMTVDENSIVCKFVNLWYDYGGGVTVHMDYIGRFGVTLVDAKDPKTGAVKKVFGLLNTVPPECTVSIHKSKKKIITDIITKIALSTVGAILGGIAGEVGEALFEVGEITEIAEESAAVAETTESVVDASADVTTMSFVDGIKQSFETGLIRLTDAVAELTGSELLTSADRSMSGMFSRIGSRIAGTLQETFMSGKCVGTVAGNFVGMQLARLPNLVVKHAKADFSSLDSFTLFCDRAMQAHTWPGAEGFDLVSLNLHRSLQIGLFVKVPGATRPSDDDDKSKKGTQR